MIRNDFTLARDIVVAKARPVEAVSWDKLLDSNGFMRFLVAFSVQSSHMSLKKQDSRADSSNGNRKLGIFGSHRIPSWDPSQDDALYQNFLNDARGKKCINYFPTSPPDVVPAPVEILPKTLNHASMELGWIEYDFGDGLEKGDTGAMYGDEFCLVHGITRVFVLDEPNHLIALVTPMRYMMYMAYNMYAKDEFKPQGNIFNFAKRIAAPRWALRAAANQILAGQGGSVQELANGYVSISGVTMDGNGKEGLPFEVFPQVKVETMSWIVMDKMLEEAKSHNVSYVVADTRLMVEHDQTRSLPLCVREDESDLIMADLVERYAGCDSHHAFQFRAGWYAPKRQFGLTRMQKRAFRGEDGIWTHEEKGTFVNKREKNPSSALWFIGGLSDIDENAQAKNVGTHMDALEKMDLKKGGLQNKYHSVPN